MPTLKLLTAPMHGNGSHQIGSPGGYEFWHFYAEDQTRRVRISAAFHDGFSLHPDYLKRYSAYRRKPTRNLPPTPSQYPCLQVNVFENEKKLAGSTTYFPAGSFKTDDASLTLGSNHAIFRPGEISLVLSEPQQAVSIELTFQSALPITTPLEQLFPADQTGKTEHHWISARPLCNLHGQFRRGGSTIPLTGLGEHNHYYGTGPVFTVASRWMRGCVLFPRAAEIFQVAGDFAAAISANEGGIQVLENPKFTAEWKKSLFSRMSYPLSMNFGDRLILRNPHIVRSISPQLQIVYDAYVQGEQNTAWVEIDCI